MTLFFCTITFPVNHTQQLRSLLEPYLPHGADIDVLTTPAAGLRCLRLHPRVAAPDALPEDLRRACAALGAGWGTEAISLTEAQTVNLFTVVFFSKSKLSPPLLTGLPRNWRRVLSNFYASSLTIGGAPYSSIEHFFQGQKALCSDRPQMALRFRADADDGVGPEPLAAKKAGGRGAYKRAGATLDVARWEQQRVPCMQAALEARWEQDDRFRTILLSTRGMRLLHFERAGARSFWGGSLRKSDGLPQGENTLGKLMTAIRDRANTTSRE